jgi:hypothetical protein
MAKVFEKKTKVAIYLNPRFYLDKGKQHNMQDYLYCKKYEQIE